MPIPILSQESPDLAIVDWCLIPTEEVSIATDVIEITWTWKSLGIPVAYAILAWNPLKEKASKRSIAVAVVPKRDQLLLHQFLTGLPHEVSKQLRATGVTTLTAAIERAKILMTVEQHTLEATVAAAQPKPTELLQLQQQITDLSAQVAALTTRQTVNRKSQVFSESRPKRCFRCNKVGHLQYNCPLHRDKIYCFTCGQQGHGWRNCPQGNEQGMAAWGSSRPRNQ